MATYSEFYESPPHGIFFVLNQGKQKGYDSFLSSDKSLHYVSAKASGSNKRLISFS